MRNSDCNHGRRGGHRGFGREDVMAAVAEAMGGRGRHGLHGLARGPFGGGFGRDFPGGMGPGGMGGGGMGGGGMGGGRGRGGPDDGDGRRGRRKRLFDQAELQVLLLGLIVDAPRHGYELIREIEALSGGDYAPSPGVVYPALIYMEETGLIAPVSGDSARKAFEPTAEGRAKAEADAEKFAELKGRLGALAAQRDRVDPAPVRRAFHALKTAVFDRLSQEGADRAFILQVADAIDEATRKIERIEK
ncbi:hypothetical protein A8V01_14320 [Novosphingobium guangzhouense]|uniref:Transcription regulator PadR N-terminal domain-containing protein n=2 Tax=Novosphingobium guangzhouense TaxID=1850347 RepID=A0A2K2G493_9SPHN|nr:hypothetical protein A8V01_14320 [Novosphingobium guangzhouense]